MRNLVCYLTLAVFLSGGRLVIAAETPSAWPRITLPEAKQVQLAGSLGETFERGVARLAEEPYTLDWLLADVSFKVGRIFTNYSGDVSGRFLELAVLSSPPGRLSPPTLAPALAEISRYQKDDGHFGAELDLGLRLTRNSPPIPMLWGNARLLVGLATAARELNEPKLLAAAKRLGDYYVNTASQLCSTNREAEYHSSGTGGDGYSCCYFPGMEGLILLYRLTGDGRYLEQARRMAEMFWRFDALPVDHSHGNLCAWRSVLELYEVTGERAFLDRAIAKWDAAVNGGFVWPLGGVGEHWYVSFGGDEGCSESDWLRFSLELWKFTGQTRYLDMAERLLENQYAANQCANGGFGYRALESQPDGPLATRGSTREWPFCCSFHGPLGLHFLKGYLAAGSKSGIYVNFPFNFTGPVKTGQGDWRVSVKTPSVPSGGQEQMELEFVPDKTQSAGPVTLWLRVPSWATGVSVGGSPRAAARVENGYLALRRDCRKHEKFLVTFTAGLAIEGRRFRPLTAKPGAWSSFSDVSLLLGAKVLFETPASGPGCDNLLATVDGQGRLDLLRDRQGGFISVSLANTNATQATVLAALVSARPVSLQPWPVPASRRRAAFSHNLLVVPAEAIPAATATQFAARLTEATATPAGPLYGTHLDAQAPCWPEVSGWSFTPQGILITGGDVGLIDGGGYEDYCFEFDLTLTGEGQGITGWIVRAQSESDCLMFQIQSADSSYRAPEFKTRPNTLRPHVRRWEGWAIADPVSLPKEIRRGETHHVATECRGSRIAVFVDGEKVHEQSDAGLRRGSVGFRVSGPAEQGRFQNITLRKL